MLQHWFLAESPFAKKSIVLSQSLKSVLKNAQIKHRAALHSAPVFLLSTLQRCSPILPSALRIQDKEADRGAFLIELPAETNLRK